MSEGVNERDRLHKVLDNMRHMRFWRKTPSQAESMTPMEHLESTIKLANKETDPATKEQLNQQADQLVPKAVKRATAGTTVTTAAAVGLASIMHVGIPAAGAGFAKAGEGLKIVGTTTENILGAGGELVEKVFHPPTREQIKAGELLDKTPNDQKTNYIVKNHPDMRINQGSANVRIIPIARPEDPTLGYFGVVTPGTPITGAMRWTDSVKDPDTGKEGQGWVTFKDPTGRVLFIAEKYLTEASKEPK